MIYLEARSFPSAIPHVDVFIPSFMYGVIKGDSFNGTIEIHRRRDNVKPEEKLGHGFRFLDGGIEKSQEENEIRFL